MKDGSSAKPQAIDDYHRCAPRPGRLVCGIYYLVPKLDTQIGLLKKRERMQAKKGYVVYQVSDIPSPSGLCIYLFHPENDVRRTQENKTHLALCAPTGGKRRYHY